MFCPRCGRPVSETANFCGGCGLPKAEIEKANQPQVDITELDATINQLENDLTGVHSVENYTTYTNINTNVTEKTEDDINNYLKNEPEYQPEESSESYQSQYSRQTPKHPYYSSGSYSQQETRTASQDETVPNQNLSTVDFIWMLLISSIPVVGFFYIIYQGFVQKENVNRQSWARATMILYLFAIAIGIVFSIGIITAQFMYW